MVWRRFIAGARCPQCEQQDTLFVTELDAGNRARECVRCGFRDTLENLPTAPPATRVEPGPVAVEAQVLRLFDPKP